MSTMRLSLITAALVVALTPTSTCWAQAYGFEGVVENNDLSWFEPVELDLDGRIAPQAGYFFHAEKLNWSIGGERVEIGNPDVENLSEEIYRENTDTLFQAFITQYAIAGFSLADITQILGVDYVRDGNGAVITTPINILDEDDNIIGVANVPQVLPGSGDKPPAPIAVVNGIKDAQPDADFAWGERYELGYSDGERGWLIGILDGPEQTTNAVYGLGPGNGIVGLNPFITTDPTDIDNNGEPDTQVGLSGFLALGFGSVAVNFSAPEDYFKGFRDYFLNTFPVGTQTGPYWTIRGTGAEEDESLDDTEDNQNSNDASQTTDDINGNGNTFFLLFGDTDGDGEDELLATFIDYGDLHEFDIYFDDVTVRNRTEMKGIEWMLTKEVNQSHRLERGRRDRLQLSYGVRYLQIDDEFSWLGTGSVLGETGAEIDVANQIVGPQIGLKWTRDRGAWDFSASGRFMFGYNIVDTGLNGTIGASLVPGGNNSLVLGRTTTTVIGNRKNDFSPLAELRLEARYKITKALAVKLGYTGKFVDNIRRASQSGVYSLPNLGLQDGKRDILVNGVNFGIEFRH